MSSSSKPLDDHKDVPETRNWLDLPRDITLKILSKVGAIAILVRVQFVCTQWHSICKDPLMWRTIDMYNLGIRNCYTWRLDLYAMCVHAIDRSCGQVVDINIENFGNDQLILYLANHARHLRRLRLERAYAVSDEVLCEVAEKLPLLEELDISICNISQDALEEIGLSCPLLKTLKLNRIPEQFLDECDAEAYAVAETMPELRHLQLMGNSLSNDGLLAILDGCPHLESLDLRRCVNVNLKGSLGKRCAQQVKKLWHPYASFDDLDYLYCDMVVFDFLS